MNSVCNVPVPCEICGKPITGHRTMKVRYHPGECLKKAKAQWYREKKRRQKMEVERDAVVSV